ncbi:hypothetical protein [Sphingobium sp. ba1]|jgi:hypothetical protein|uniref:hypothetical protein n=1 Tax=Sphingobium sp. ba1 TaxID=1522072 RepID=UPI00056BC351|nr:hypothetical protein [Sphingobium sp. ba1]
MNAASIKKARDEAKRFMALVQPALDHEEGEARIWPSPARSALRRASMDLTRALADMRRPS